MEAITLIKEVKVFMGEEELTSDDIKKYICISPIVSEIVSRVYYRNKKSKLF